MEINMKNITKVGLSALAGALAVTSANAGDMSLSGSMEASYTTGSGYSDVGNPLGMDKELSVTASGELDDGTSVSYKQTITDAMAYNDSELKFGTSMGDIAMTSAGSPLSAIDDVTPNAFEEANALLGSIDDVNGVDGTYGIRYTLADAMGSGFTVDAMYVPKHGTGDAQADNGKSGTSGTEGNGSGYELVVKGSVPMISGLDVGAGYAKLEKRTNETTADDSESIDQHEGTAYINYAMGPVKVGYQVGAVTMGTSNKEYKTKYLGVSYAVSDNLSVSYNDIQSDFTNQTGASTEQDFESVSASYTMGSMTLSIADSEVSNATYTDARSVDATSISMAIAF
tara:strand:- start:484 stop:1506 length:1023 start_codon:yes stop_codon:yes gene_type:complete